MLSIIQVLYPFSLILLQIFVGGIDPDVTEEDLREPFTQFGEVVSVKIPVGKGCGFVQLDNRCGLYLRKCWLVNHTRLSQ